MTGGARGGVACGPAGRGAALAYLGVFGGFPSRGMAGDQMSGRDRRLNQGASPKPQNPFRVMFELIYN